MARCSQVWRLRARPSRCSLHGTGGLLRGASLTFLLLTCAAIGVALAHHSFALFDTAYPLALTGVVTDFQWTNPHVYIELDVAEGIKGAKHWTIELGSPSILMRGGWKFNTLKMGDKV